MLSNLINSQSAQLSVFPLYLKRHMVLVHKWPKQPFELMGCWARKPNGQGTQQQGKQNKQVNTHCVTWLHID